MNTRIGEQEANAAFWKNDNVLKNGEKASSLDIFLDKWGIFENSPAVFCNSVKEFSATSGGSEQKHFGFVKSIEFAGQGIELVWEKFL
jgi:hypothetical protein